jgi:peptide/nickel transport system substrate-binding protein
MTGRRRIYFTLLALAALILIVAVVRGRAPRPAPGHDAPSTTAAPASTAIVATLRSEPATFNRFTGNGFPTYLVSLLTQARLVRINRATHALEPWLADRWTSDADGRRYEVHLREGVRFSDGHPFSADDVVFSFRAAYDKATSSTIGDTLTVDGKPLAFRALGPNLVEITFPAPNPGLRLLDSLPIYPAHLLTAALDKGAFAEAWGPTTPPASMAGLGPFMLASYEPGQRLVFTKNPHYWRAATGTTPVPALDRLTLEIVPDQNAELLRLQAGQVDLMQSELRPEDYLPVKRDADGGRLRLLDIGRSLESHVLWFNLRPHPGAARAWLRREEFRRALSHAVDRADFVRTVYLGAAEPSWGLVAPANAGWFDATAPTEAFDPARAASLLAGLGLKDTNGDGVLEDPSGAPVRFSVLLQKGITPAEKGAAVLRERLAAVGVTLDVVALDVGAMMTRWQQGDYDAIYHQLSPTDTDPAGNLDFWLSSGGSHVWNPGQPRPATDWERQVDDLMRRQARSLDEAERHRLFGEVQRLIAEYRPAMTFAVPHVYVATSARLRATTLAVQRPQLLWDVETLAVDDRAAIH